MIVVVGPTPSYQRVMVFERVDLNRVNRALEVTALASGKGVNCARAIKHLGKSAIHLSLLGGITGDRIAKSLEKEGIETQFVKTACPTRSCVTLLEKQTGQVTELIENAGEVETKCAGEILQAFKSLAENCRVVVCIGTLAPGMPSNFYREILRVAYAKNIQSILDTQGDALLEALQERPTLVKINISELSAATQLNCESEKNLRKGLKKLHEKGAKSILITRGAKDAVLSETEKFERIKLPRIQVLNSTGAGDSLAAGIATYLSEGKCLREAVRFGIACGSAAAAGAGYGQIDPLKVVQCTEN